MCRGGLTFKFDENPLIYSILNFNLGGFVLCLGMLSPPKPPVATGMLLGHLSKQVVPKVGVYYPHTILRGVTPTRNLNFKLPMYRHNTSILVAFFLQRKILRVIRLSRYLELGNGLNKFGNHWSKLKYVVDADLFL